MSNISVGVAGWVSRVNAAWQASFESVIETGKLLIEAKKALPHGDFERMVETELFFSARTAQRLMKVARDKRIANAAHASHLPPHWGTLYALTKLDDDAFNTALRDGIIHADMERKDVPVKAEKPRRAPTITDADYTELPSPALPPPGEAVPAGLSGPESAADEAATTAVVTDDRDGGESDRHPFSPGASAEPQRIVPDGPQATPAASAPSDAGGRTAGAIPATGVNPIKPTPQPRAPDGSVIFTVKPRDGHSAALNGLLMLLYGLVGEHCITGAELAESWPGTAALFSDDIAKIIDELMAFEAGFRSRNPGGGNAAALESEAAE